MSEPSCTDYRRLKDLHDAAMRAYIEGAKTLENTPEGPAFEGAYQAAENAMVAFVTTRENLEKHITVHGCAEVLEPHKLQ